MFSTAIAISAAPLHSLSNPVMVPEGLTVTVTLGLDALNESAADLRTGETICDPSIVMVLLAWEAACVGACVATVVAAWVGATVAICVAVGGIGVFDGWVVGWTAG